MRTPCCERLVRSDLTADQRLEIKERGWRGPRRLNEYGEMETMELSHQPIPLRDGGTEVVPRWPADHAAVDPHQKLKKWLIEVKLKTMSIDYGNSGKTIQRAMVDHALRHPDKKTRPPYILWDGLQIQTFDRVQVKSSGWVRFEILKANPATVQGFDAVVDEGFVLGDGTLIKRLRTWKDERLEDIVEYRYTSHSGRMGIWNVYEMEYPSGKRIVEHGTGNAGFWIERIGDGDQIYHCSAGADSSPDFESLVFRVTLK